MPRSELAVPAGSITALIDDPEALADYQNRQVRQQLALAMLGQGHQQPQGQMAGRFYVPPSPVQGLSQMLQAGLGAYLLNKTGQDSTEAAKTQGAQQAAGQQQLIAAMQNRSTPGTQIGRAHV